MALPLQPDLIVIRRSIAAVGALSDGLYSIGGFSIGLDGLLSWIPGLGEIYSGAAAIFLMVQGYRARVPAGVLLLAGAMMLARTAITAIPLAGPVASDLLTTHKWAAKLLLAAIDKRLARTGAQGLAGAAAYG